jgi:integrase
MGHVDVEMVFRHYGKWIPEKNAAGRYQPVNDWSKSIFNDTSEEKEQN